MPKLEQQNIVILGTGSFAEEVADLISEIDGLEVVSFVEGLEADKNQLVGLPVVWIEDISAFRGHRYGVCAVGSTQRRGFILRAEEQGLEFTTIVHPSAHVPSSSSLGIGAIVSPRVVVGARAEVGRHVILNRGCLVGHHTIIGDYVTVSPGANIAGRVRIGEGTYVGMGAIVLDGIAIGRGSIVGAGAVVTRDVPDSVQVLGVPARVVKHLAA